VHRQTLGWARLSEQRREEKLNALGITSETLSEIRLLEPRERIIRAAEIALTIDEERNSDFIECIAGYEGRAALSPFSEHGAKDHFHAAPAIQ
jgi:hypothetical protein